MPTSLNCNQKACKSDQLDSFYVVHVDCVHGTWQNDSDVGEKQETVVYFLITAL